MVQRVQQEHHWGCQVAVLAMIMDISYREALAYYPCDPDTCRGFISLTLETILTEQGYAIARKYRYRAGFGNEPRSEWPPLPFGLIHWCQVTTVSGGAHAIILLDDGTVLDPWTPTRNSLSHPDYSSVDFVAAIIKF